MSVIIGVTTIDLYDNVLCNLLIGLGLETIEHGIGLDLKRVDLTKSLQRTDCFQVLLHLPVSASRRAVNVSSLLETFYGLPS